MRVIIFVLLSAGVLSIGLSQSVQQASQTNQAYATQAKKAASAKEKVAEAKRLMLDAKKELAREGRYDCCVKDPCNQCLLDHQSCSCERDVKVGKPVCPECYGGWMRGEGKIKNIKASDVKTEFSGHKH